MEYADYRRHDAVGLAALVAAGEISPTEVLETAIDRAEKVNGRLNAIVRPMYESARRRAAEPLTGPLAGVPFLLKDLQQDYAGLPSGSGSAALQRLPAPRHSTAVERWLEAGVVIFGKTNTPEFGAKSITEPQSGGATRNPWNLDRTPGGSSGGAAAAVAAGIVPVAGASDGGGSIRIPAACCGLFGLKPGRGLISAGPDHAEHLHGAATQGVISRTVRDTAAMLDVLTAPDPGGPYLAARPDASYTDLARRDPGRLRIGYTVRSPLGSQVHPEAVAAVEHAATLLTALGHDVQPAEPAIDGEQLARDFMTMWTTQLAFTLARTQQSTGTRHRGYELDTRLLAAAGRATRVVTLHTSHARWNVHTRALAAFHDDYDLLLTPTLAEPPVRIGELDTPSWMRLPAELLLRLRLVAPLARTPLWQNLILANLRTVPFTQLANLTGRPAMSVPLHHTPQGLPLGVQFTGPLAGEGTLLALAAQLEAEHPWSHREPPL